MLRLVCLRRNADPESYAYRFIPYLLIYDAGSRSCKITTILIFKSVYYCIFLTGWSVLSPFAYVAHFLFLRDVWIRTQRADVAGRCADNLATHLPIFGRWVAMAKFGRKSVFLCRHTWRISHLMGKPPEFRREHTTLQNMTFLNFFGDCSVFLDQRTRLNSDPGRLLLQKKLRMKKILCSLELFDG